METGLIAVVASLVAVAGAILLVVDAVIFCYTRSVSAAIKRPHPGWPFWALAVG
jgi:hypothetical protein